MVKGNEWSASLWAIERLQVLVRAYLLTRDWHRSREPNWLSLPRR